MGPHLLTWRRRARAGPGRCPRAAGRAPPGSPRNRPRPRPAPPRPREPQGPRDPGWPRPGGGRSAPRGRPGLASCHPKTPSPSSLVLRQVPGRRPSPTTGHTGPEPRAPRPAHRTDRTAGGASFRAPGRPPESRLAWTSVFLPCGPKGSVRKAAQRGLPRTWGAGGRAHGIARRPGGRGGGERGGWGHRAPHVRPRR